MANKGSNGYRWLQWGWGVAPQGGLILHHPPVVLPRGFPSACEVDPVLPLSLGWGYCLPRPSSHLQDFIMPVGNIKDIIRKIYNEVLNLRLYR